MFRLKDQQLHILIGLLFGASILLFFVFGYGRLPEQYASGMSGGMQDFSEGWACTYETRSQEKLAEHNKSEGDRTISEVLNLPVEINIPQGKTAVLTRRVPEVDAQTLYLMFETRAQRVKVIVDGNVIYSSALDERGMSSLHTVPVDAGYRNKTLAIEMTSQTKDTMQIDTILYGTYVDMLVQAFHENGILLIAGFLMTGIGVCLFIAWMVSENVWKQRRLLLYGSLQGAVLGMLFMAESRLVQVVANWSYGLFLIRACLIVLSAVLHFMTIRCFVYKKKVLLLIDIAILLWGIFYISVMVMQAFSLLLFDDIYFAGIALYSICILLYTIVIAVNVFKYLQKECRPLLGAQVFLSVCVLAEGILYMLENSTHSAGLYAVCGFLVYMFFVWIQGLKQAFRLQAVSGESDSERALARKQFVEQLNANLLFAAFQTLQNLIKSGSEKSVKMIYYISVYIRGNLKALELGERPVPFEEELEHIIAYLQLQKTRNANLDFQIECKEKGFYVPRRSLEPMVENAVKYGIAGNNNSGNVVLRSYQRKEGYAVQIIDDGIGFDKKVLKRKSPTALLNLASLLEQSCSAKTEIVSKEGKGTVITIILPMLENDLMEN